jgi:hypothetical protein
MFRFFTRNLFSATQLTSGAINHRVSAIQVPKEFSKELVDKISTQIPVGAKNFKPTTLQNINSQNEIFNDLLDKFPQLKKQIDESKDFPIILIQGLKTPELEMSKIPKSKYQEDEIYKNPEIKIGEIMAGLMMQKFINIYSNVQAFNLIYPTTEDIGRTDSFASDRELSWHSDGWGSYPEKNVALFCVVGNDSAITEVITSRQIIDHFVENKKEHLLKYLAKDFHIYSGGEEHIVPQAKILDEKGNIRFSEYGRFESSAFWEDRKVSEEAIKELKIALKKISPALSHSMENGDILIVDNLQNLHRRTTLEGSPSMDPSRGSSRLLLRANLEEGQQK